MDGGEVACVGGGDTSDGVGVLEGGVLDVLVRHVVFCDAAIDTVRGGLVFVGKVKMELEFAEGFGDEVFETGGGVSFVFFDANRVGFGVTLQREDGGKRDESRFT